MGIVVSNVTCRAMAREIVWTQCTLVRHAEREVFRAANYYAEGLTPKEREFLTKRHETLKGELELLEAFYRRLAKSYGDEHLYPPNYAGTGRSKEKLNGKSHG